TCEECAKIDKAELYGRHFGPLAQRVVDAGHTPAVWGDMFVDHPEALDHLPKETIVFDWQYFKGVKDTARQFTDKGFRVVGCPTLHVYNAPWFHIEKSEQNVRQVSRDIKELGLHGVCLTTWESGLLGAYDTLFPAISESVKVMDDPDTGSFLEAYGPSSEWARLMGVELEGCGGVFAFSGHRNKLKSRALLYSNPFLAWMHHAEELCGERGDRALAVIEQASQVAKGEAEKGVCTAVRSMIDFVRIAEEARLLYARNEPEAAINRLTATRTIFDMMMRIARRSHDRIGGSLADAERCKAALDHVDRVIVRLRNYGRRQLGYLPAWEILTHPMFVPHDQACWWLVNGWGKE
ncbi:MAG TPA: hypothetical protein VNI20_03585, partial [Fimbriimonadaceae bacterium]|nr:hypothetical protein [Fimbriimonadaceae bacterium]